MNVHPIEGDHIKTLSSINVSIEIEINFNYSLEVVFLKFYTGDLGYDRLNGTRKIGPSYAKSVLYI